MALKTNALPRLLDFSLAMSLKIFSCHLKYNFLGCVVKLISCSKKLRKTHTPMIYQNGFKGGFRKKYSQRKMPKILSKSAIA